MLCCTCALCDILTQSTFSAQPVSSPPSLPSRRRNPTSPSQSGVDERIHSAAIGGYDDESGRDGHDMEREHNRIADAEIEPPKILPQHNRSLEERKREDLGVSALTRRSEVAVTCGLDERAEEDDGSATSMPTVTDVGVTGADTHLPLYGTEQIASTSSGPGRSVPDATAKVNDTDTEQRRASSVAPIASLQPPLPPPPSLPPQSQAYLSVQHLNLGSLDPMARDLLLAQQRQLSDLQEQLRLLQAAMREAPVRMSIDHAPLPYTPVVVVRSPTTGSSQLRPFGVNDLPEEAVKNVPEARAAVMVEATTNTSIVWGPAAIEDSHAAPTSTTSATTHGAAALTTTTSGTNAEHSFPIERVTTTAEPMSAPPGQRDEQRADDLPAEQHTDVGWTSHRDTPVRVRARPRDKRDTCPASGDISCSEDDASLVIALRVPGHDDDEHGATAASDFSRAESAVGAAARDDAQRALERECHPRNGGPATNSSRAVSNAVVEMRSDNDQVSGITQEEEENDKNIRVVSPSSGVSSVPALASAGTMGSRGDRPRQRDDDSLGRSCAVDRGGLGVGSGSVNGGVWRQPLGVAGRRRSAQTVLPVSIADLVMVPRIEFGQLTDDELGSDLDEGEVRIKTHHITRRCSCTLCDV